MRVGRKAAGLIGVWDSDSRVAEKVSRLFLVLEAFEDVRGGDEIDQEVI